MNKNNDDRTDELMNRLSKLDPVASDTPPAIGSIRYDSSKEHAMSATSESTSGQATTPVTRRRPSTAAAAAPDTDPVAPRQTRRSRRHQLALAASAIIVAIVALTFVLPGGSTASATAAVRTAAANSANITSLRIDMESTDLSIVPGGRATVEVSGQDVHLSAPGLDWFVVDGTASIVEDGVVVATEFSSDVIAPYGESSRLVIEAALQSNDVTDEGVEVINGVETTRYVVQIDTPAHDALAAIPAGNLIWFTEETEEEISVEEDGEVDAFRSGFLEDADSLTIWIANDLIHQISVEDGSSQFTHSYYDFNADIEIVVPGQ